MTGRRSSLLVPCLAVIALLAVAPGAAAVSRAVPETGCTPRASTGYTERVTAALSSNRDVWGAELLAAPGGPTYAGAAGRLAPLLYARTAKQQPLTRSGVYYLPFAMPRSPGGAGQAMLHVADGSEILAGRTTGPSIEVFVGTGGRERYGSCLARLASARLAGGWLPILETSYRDAEGDRYTQESFAARADGTLASFVRLTVATQVPVRLRIGELSTSVPRDTTRTLYARWAPPGRPVAIDASAYVAARASVEAYWRGRLAGGTQIDVPERRVQDAERALLVQNLVLGWRYSVGNPYEEFSFPETIDDARVLGEYGFAAADRAALVAALPRRPTPYPSWKMGEKLLGFASYYELFHDRETLGQVNGSLSGFLTALEGKLGANGLLAPERYSSDIPDLVYGLHAQAVVWQGLREIARVWSETGRPTLAARARKLAGRLGSALRSTVRRVEQPLPDGSLFVPMRLLGHERAYGTLTASRAGSYWNLVAPYALASGIFAPGSNEARGTLRYLLLHGSRLLGLVRSAAYGVYGPAAGEAISGTNQVYGNNLSRFLADLDLPGQLDLSLYGQLAAGMTPNTFVAGEAASVAPLDGLRDRAMYLPPNAAANATFLETLRLTLVHETADGLDLAFATPRAWLAAGKRVAVSGFPTRFGPVSYEIRAGASLLRVKVGVPGRTPPAHLRLRLRLPAGESIGTVTPSLPVNRRTQTIDLSGLRGSIELEVSVNARS